MSSWRRFRRTRPAAPISTLEGDLEFMNFFAAFEGQLPDSYFNFDRKTIDFPAAFADHREAAQAHAGSAPDPARGQARRSSTATSTVSPAKSSEVAWLLGNRWDEVHPQAERGDFTSRLAQLGTLNDGPVVVLPLQYATLLQTEREGRWPIAR